MSEKIGEYVGRRNALNRVEGAKFEAEINAACEYYRIKGVADIEKTPEPMKPIKSVGHGRFEAIYTGKAQPDYKGVLIGGRTVAFEAKYTDTGRMMQSRVTDDQAEHLERISRYGGVVFVLCEFDGQGVWKVPWYIWRDMKNRYGRKYIMPSDAIGDKLNRTSGGTLDFLAGTNKNFFKS